MSNITNIQTGLINEADKTSLLTAMLYLVESTNNNIDHLYKIQKIRELTVVESGMLSSLKLNLQTIQTLLQ